MGQEQSNSNEVPSGGDQESHAEPGNGKRIPNNPGPDIDSSASDPGVRVVQRIEEACRSEDSGSAEAKQLLEKSKQLPLPQPLLPAQPEDSLTAALHGAQMIQEIRTLFGNLLATAEQAKPSFLGIIDSSGDREQKNQPPQPQTAQASSSTQTLPSGGDDDRVSDTQTTQPATAIATAPTARDSMFLHAEAIEKVITECTGGKRMNKVVDAQKRLITHIRQISELATRLETAVALNVESAKNTTRAMEKLDRLSMSVADVHDSLENIVATANILGASHFADNEEMRSFKDFLKHNPPKT